MIVTSLAHYRGLGAVGMIFLVEAVQAGVPIDWQLGRENLALEFAQEAFAFFFQRDGIGTRFAGRHGRTCRCSDWGNPLSCFTNRARFHISRVIGLAIRARHAIAGLLGKDLRCDRWAYLCRRSLSDWGIALGWEYCRRYWLLDSDRRCG